MAPSKIPERTKKSIKGLGTLVNYLKERENVKELAILEIGSWTGCSAELFAKNFREVYCLDPWKATEGINTKYNMNEVEKIFDKRMGKYKNVIKIKKTAKEFFDYLEKENIEKEYKFFDVIYIDGIHTYEAVKKDIINSLKLKPKYIAGHDYWQKKFPGVIKAVDEMLGKPDKIFFDSSWVKELK